MVRLRLVVVTLNKFFRIYFNSNMVRLRRKRLCEKGADTQFQFQYGAIKTAKAVAAMRAVKSISIPIWCD